MIVHFVWHEQDDGFGGSGIIQHHRKITAAIELPFWTILASSGILRG